MTSISGNTFPVKDALKALGGRWDPEQKCWMVPDTKSEAARALVGGGSLQRRQPAVSSNSTYRPTKCSQCGQRASQYNPIYRSGLCRGCWKDEKEEREMGY